MKSLELKKGDRVYKNYGPKLGFYGGIVHGTVRLVTDHCIYWTDDGGCGLCSDIGTVFKEPKRKIIIFNKEK